VKKTQVKKIKKETAPEVLMEVLKREKFFPITLYPGDSLTLTWTAPPTIPPPPSFLQRCVSYLSSSESPDPVQFKTVLCKHTINAEQEMVTDEAVIFAATFEGRRAIGVLVVEQEKK
jgi:hypothetical protein